LQQNITVVFFFQYPLQTYGYAFLFSVFGYLGVNVVLVLLKLSGALVAVTGTYYFLGNKKKFIHLMYMYYINDRLLLDLLCKEITILSDKKAHCATSNQIICKKNY
jgi:hypothetical protein